MDFLDIRHNSMDDKKAVQIRNNILEQKFWGDNPWKDDGECWSNEFGGTDKLWQDIIYPKIQPYLKGNVLEIAPGYGRITRKVLEHASSLSIVDMNKPCIDYCRERFKDKDNMQYFVNDGLSLREMENNSYDFIFSWDSFVHMQKYVIESYLKDISKKLKSGGYGAIHHGNVGGGSDDYSFQNLSGRSNFNADLFKEMCEKYGMEVVDQHAFEFGTVFDIISIFRKKADNDTEKEMRKVSKSIAGNHIMFLVQHLSTGGMPQYVCWLVEELLKIGKKIDVVEFSDIAPIYVVQKNKLKDMLGNNLTTLYGSDEEKRDKLLALIDEKKPDVLHLQEFPEMWLPDFISERIYKEDREYGIVETSHDSGFNTSGKRFFPDKFAFISNFHPPLYEDLDIPWAIVEYPIVKKERPNREESLRELGLDPSYKHVLNVGLFTPRKNQAEIFKIAESMKGEKIQFHFVGNQAGNFKHYWEPLMKNKPDNCKIWGERGDVDKFYSSMDLFLFTSRGTDKDRETNPLVIKEALGWDMPTLIYNLPVYCGMYDNHEKVHYLTGDIDNDAVNVKKVLDGEKIVFVNGNYFKDVDARFDYVESKIYLNFHLIGDEVRKIRVSVRDIDTNLPIYVCDIDAVNRIQYWVMPLPPIYFNFKEDEFFNGFLIEFYEPDGSFVFSKELRLRNNPPSVDVRFKVGYNDMLYPNFLEFFHYGFYDEVDFKDGVLIDIGANIGCFTKFALTRGAKKVYSVEPCKTSLDVLRDNFEDDDNVEIIDKAIDKVQGETEMFYRPECSPMSSFYKEELGKGGVVVKSQKVETILLSDLVRDYNIGHIDVLKIDIEGKEYDVFDSIDSELLSKIDQIVLEFHMNTEGKLRKHVLNKLDANGFSYNIYSQTSKDADTEDKDMARLVAKRRVSV